MLRFDIVSILIFSLYSFWSLPHFASPAIGMIFNLCLSLLFLPAIMCCKEFRGPASIIYLFSHFILINFFIYVVILYFSAHDSSKLIALLNYQFRFITLIFLFLYIYILTYNINDENIKRLFNCIIIFCLSGSLLEVVTRDSSLSFFIDMFKARSPGLPIDTLHYSRLSGFFSFPGDWGILLVFAISLVPQTSYRKFTKILITTALLYFLFLTQSRAAFATLLVFWFLVYFRHHPVLTICYSLIGIMSLPYILKKLAGFDLYLLRNVESLERFISSSKRVSEYLDLTVGDIIFGLPSSMFHDFYETEIAGLLARLGIFALFPIVIIFLLALRNYIKREKKLVYIPSFLLAYILPYCFISAGFSRPKLSVLAMVVVALNLKLLSSRHKD